MKQKTIVVKLDEKTHEQFKKVCKKRFMTMQGRFAQLVSQDIRDFIDDQPDFETAYEKSQETRVIKESKDLFENQ